MGALEVLGTLFVLIVGGAVWYYISLITGDKDKEVREDIVVNTMTQYTDGSAWGRVKKTHRKDGWLGIEYYPRDKNPKKLEEEKKKLKAEIVFIPKENLEPINKGEWSADYNINIILPIKEGSMPNSLKNSSIGMGARIKSVEKEGERFEERIRAVRDKNVENATRDIKGLDIIKIRESLLKEGITGKENETPEKKK